MADTAEQTAATSQQTQEKQPIPISTGKVQRLDIALPKDNPNTDTGTDNGENNEGANATSGASNGGVADGKPNGTPPAPITDEILKAYFKEQGIEYEGVDKLKEKLNYKPETTPTPEQIQEAEKAKDVRALNKFIAGGGTGDQYYALKAVAEADVAELSTNTLKIELKAAGFNDTEVTDIIKERYYQIEVEELEQLDTETDEDFEKRKESIKRKKEYGAKKLANRSLPIKNQAAGVLADLQKAIESEDLQVKNELTISSNIDEQFKTLARNDTYEIGEINKVKIPPIQSEVPESELAEAFQTLKDPARRKQFLENQDGTLNYTNIANLLAENAKLKAAIKVSYHEGSTRTNAHWENRFGARSPYELGVGGSPEKPNGQQKGQPVSSGKPVKIQPNAQR